MKRASMMLCTLMASIVASAANTWWVDAAHAAGGTYDGRSDQTGFGTIQEAVDAADSGDTIKVLPGTYDQGGKSDGWMFSRVAILAKKIRLESTGGRDVTFIVGRHSAGSVHGDNAIRCIYADTANTEVVGFTICDGDTKANSSNSDGCGGGLYAASSYIRAIDCTFRNCWGARGGALYSGTAIRCLFVGNKMYNGANGAIARASYLFNCIGISNVPANQPALQGCAVVNCTFVGNGSGSLFSESSLFRNCLALANGNNAANGCYDYRGSVLSAPCDNLGMAEGCEVYLADVVTNTPNTLLKAPALGDFRPLAGTAAATNGQAAIMMEDFNGNSFAERIPEAERYLDFNRQEIPENGTICAGAIQSVAPAPVCGAISFAAGQIAVNGMPTVVDDLYMYPDPDTYPAQVRLTPDFFYGSAGRDVYVYWIVDGSSSSNYRNPNMDESFYVMPPVSPASLFRVGVLWAGQTYTVAKGGNDANDGITAPFATLQRAADVAADYSLVKVGEGVYGDDQGSSVWDGHNTRLQVSDKHIRFKGAGREKTIIEGKADTTVAYNGGQGPAAIRCVSTSCSLVALQGFTFRNGFAGWNNSTEQKSYSGGGALYLSNSANPVSDCMFTNCAGYRGTCFGGSYSRCDLYQCKGSNGGMRSVGYYASCKFVQCPGSNTGGPFCSSLDSTAAFLNCSVYGQTSSDTYGGTIPCWNTAVRYGKEIKANTTYCGCLFYNITTPPSSATGWRNVWPQYVAQPMDLRPMAGSPCETSGAVPTMDNYGANWHLYATTDLNGLPMHFNESGAPMVGCHQRPVTTVDVTAPTYGTITPSGTFAIDDGESVTFTYVQDPTASRSIEGFVINGTFVPTNGVDYSCVYTVPGMEVFPARFGISVVISTNWYVNVLQPNDNGDGFTPSTAKRTLAGIMSCAVQSGDVIHVAPGEYAEGGMSGHLGPNAQTTNRVEIASGVTLVSDEGADATVIRGKLSDAPFSSGYPAYGRGPGAMRAVWMGANAKLKGFTIVDGMTAALTTPATSEPDNLDTTGGGIYASDSSCIIEGCVITNCTANRSGGVQGGTLVNCALYQNASIGSSQGDAGSANRFYGCYIGKQRASNCTKGTPKLENCTVEGAVINSSGLIVKNCLFLGSTTTLKAASGVVWSVFEDRATITNSSPCVYENCKFRPASALQLDAGHVPVYGACEAIGAGNADYLAAVLSATGVDAAGGQRIYNGTLDAGAFECDFRPIYAAVLGVRVTVDHADPAVTLDGGKVRLTDGSLINGRWKPLSTTDMTSFRIMAEASGAGGLEGCFSNGNSFEKVFETGSSIAEWRFKATLADLDFAIVFDGDGYGLVSQFSQKLPGFRINFH